MVCMNKTGNNKGYKVCGRGEGKNSGAHPRGVYTNRVSKRRKRKRRRRRRTHGAYAAQELPLIVIKTHTHTHTSASVGVLLRFPSHLFCDAAGDSSLPSLVTNTPFSNRRFFSDSSHSVPALLTGECDSLAIVVFYFLFTLRCKNL